MKTIVSKCPHCGAPIYGKKRINDDTDPVVTFACVCRTTVPHNRCACGTGGYSYIYPTHTG